MPGSRRNDDADVGGTNIKRICSYGAFPLALLDVPSRAMPRSLAFPLLEKPCRAAPRHAPGSPSSENKAEEQVGQNRRYSLMMPAVKYDSATPTQQSKHDFNDPLRLCRSPNIPDAKVLFCLIGS